MVDGFSSAFHAVEACAPHTQEHLAILKDYRLQRNTGQESACTHMSAAQLVNLCLPARSKRKTSGLPRLKGSR